MDYHHHARLTVHGREFLCRSVVEGRLICARRQPSTGSAGRAQASGSDGIGNRVWTVSGTGARVQASCASLPRQS